MECVYFKSSDLSRERQLFFIASIFGRDTAQREVQGNPLGLEAQFWFLIRRFEIEELLSEDFQIY